MFYLIITILLNTVISVILKLFSKYKIDAFQAIVVNYVVCVIIGSIFIKAFPINAGSVHQSWSPWALLLGFGFILVFNLLAYCTRVDGITTSTISNKLSLVIPVIFSIFLYSEHVGLGKIAGIILAFPAVYLTSKTKNEERMQSFFWPALLFVTSGLLDTLMKFSEHTFLSTQALQAVFTIHIFACAGIIGIIIMLVLLLTGKSRLRFVNFIAGICLALPNFFSIYYFIRMLNSNFLQSSAAIPVNNIGILVTSSLVAILFFKEKVTTIRIIGLGLSIASILLIALADFHGRSI